MSDRILKLAALFDPLLDKFKQILLQHDVIYTDETTVSVISGDKIKVTCEFTVKEAAFLKKTVTFLTLPYPIIKMAERASAQ